MNYEFHEIAAIFQLLEGRDFDDLVADVRQQGLVQPVILYEGKILDGRNRYRACGAAGVEPRFTEFTGTPEEAIARVWSLNYNRRQLSSSQRACADAVKNKLLDHYRQVREAAKARQVGSLKQGNQPPVVQLIGQRKEPESLEVDTHATRTSAVRAKAAGTNREYIDMADRLLEEEPETFAEVQSGKKNLNTVKKEKYGGGKKRKKTVRTTPSAIGQKANLRVVESCIKCAQKGRPLSYPEIAAASGYAASYIDEFVTNCQLIPWLWVEPSYPKGERRQRGKYDRDSLFQFHIDEKLKAICEDEQMRPAQYTSVMKLVKDLNDEIKRMREEMQGKGRSVRWNPDGLAKAEIARVLDYVQDRIDLILNPESAVA